MKIETFLKKIKKFKVELHERNGQLDFSIEGEDGVKNYVSTLIQDDKIRAFWLHPNHNFNPEDWTYKNLGYATIFYHFKDLITSIKPILNI